jgi:CDP-diacylglycerol--glycerol-3-phosphate 3-phosphatidyltransferase
MWVTLFRIALVPVIVALMLLKTPYWSLMSGVLFIVASVTDWLDGYLARKLNSTSDMGKLLDPIADKVLVSSVLLLFISLKWFEALGVLILINRDVIIGGVRSMAASKGQVIAAGNMGKWKTTLQMVGIPCLCFFETWDVQALYIVGYYGLWISVVLSLVSGVQYFIAFQKAA